MPLPNPGPRPPLTHFLCIPLATPATRPQLADSLAAFHADVAATTVTMGGGGGGGGPSSFNGTTSSSYRSTLPRAALRPVGTLHLTLGVLSLAQPERLQQAVAVLEGLPAKLAAATAAGGSGSGSVSGSDRPGLQVSLRGLHAMQPPMRASVLYAAPVEEPEVVTQVTQATRAAGTTGEDRLRPLCERVRAAFSDLVVDDGRPLLLHATIVNTVYAQGRRGDGRRGGGGRGGRGGSRGGSRGGGRGTGRGGKITFDARELLDRYDDYVWAEHVPVDTVALCRMGAQTVAVDDDGEMVDAAYPVEAEVRL